MPSPRPRSPFDYRRNRAWAENLSIVMQIGLTMAGCIGFCFFLGLKLDGWLGTRGVLTVVMTLLGVAGGANVVYRQIMEIFSQPDAAPSEDKPPEAEDRADPYRNRPLDED